MTQETTAPAQLQALAKAVAASVDGTMVDLKKTLSLPDDDDTELVKARDKAIVAAASGIEHAFALGIHAGTVHKAEADEGLSKAEAVAAILDQVDALANQMALDGMTKSGETLAVDMAGWRAQGLSLLAKAAKADDEEAEDEAAEGEDPSEDAKGKKAKKDCKKSAPVDGLTKFHSVLSAIKLAADAATTEALQKSESPVAATRVSLAAQNLSDAFNGLDADLGKSLVKGAALSLESTLAKEGRAFSAANLARFQALQQRLKEIDKEICDMTGILDNEEHGEGIPGGEGIGTDTNLVTKGDDLSPANRMALLKSISK